MTFTATLATVSNRGTPPVSFLQEILAWGKTAPDSIFAPNPELLDIYGRMIPVLGPWQGPLHRRAVMLEVLRVLAGFESSWNFECGRDTSAGPETPEAMEAGAWQVSYDSTALDHAGSLLALCAANGIDGPWTFQIVTKANHSFAMTYCATLLRFSTDWDGPINRGWVAGAVSRAAVAEFLDLLKS